MLVFSGGKHVKELAPNMGWGGVRVGFEDGNYKHATVEDDGYGCAIKEIMFLTAYIKGYGRGISPTTLSQHRIARPLIFSAGSHFICVHD